MQARYIGTTTLDLQSTYSALLELCNLDVRSSIDNTWLQKHPIQAAAVAIGTKKIVSFVFLANLSCDAAVKLSADVIVHPVHDSVWVVALTWDNINSLCSHITKAKSDDYLDFLRFVILKLDVLGYELDYEKDVSYRPFVMRPKWNRHT